MQSSKRSIRAALERLPIIKLRRILDPEGDTGCFLISVFPDRRAAVPAYAGLREEGFSAFSQGTTNVVMSDWGLHIYYNIPSLIHRSP